MKSRKRGRPKLPPEDIMTKTIQTVKALRLKGAPVSNAVINAIAKGVVMAEDRCLLAEYGGHLAFSDQWARNILNEIMWTEKKMVWRIATTSKAPVAPSLLKEEKFTFQRKIQELVTWHKIPKLIINFDQTPLSYITVANTRLSFLMRSRCLLMEKKKENKSLVRLVLLLQVSFCPFSSFTLGRIDSDILKLSHFQIDLT